VRSGSQRPSPIGALLAVRQKRHGPRPDVLNAVQDHRQGGVEQHFVMVGVKLAHGPVASRQSVSEIHAGRADTFSKASTWPLLGRELARESTQWRRVPMGQRPQDLGKGRIYRRVADEASSSTESSSSSDGKWSISRWAGRSRAGRSTANGPTVTGWGGRRHLVPQALGCTQVHVSRRWFRELRSLI
jgi:hypothetical protein